MNVSYYVIMQVLSWQWCGNNNKLAGLHACVCINHWRVVLLDDLVGMRIGPGCDSFADWAY
jgi:hypothetical protein